MTNQDAVPSPINGLFLVHPSHVRQVWLNMTEWITMSLMTTAQEIYVIQCTTVKSPWARWRLKSPASWQLTHQFVQVQVKENIKAPRHWPLWGEFTDDRWIPPQRAIYQHAIRLLANFVLGFMSWTIFARNSNLINISWFYPQILLKWSLQDFAHDVTAALSWHVQTFMMIW